MASISSTVALSECGDQAGQPRGLDEHGQEHERLEELGRDPVPPDDLRPRHQRQHDRVDPEVDHPEQPERPVRDALPSHLAHPGDARPDVDGKVRAQPPECEDEDDAGDDRHVGRDPDHLEAEQNQADADEALRGLVDDVGVGEVLHPFDRLERRLQRLGDQRQDRHRGDEVEDRGGLVSVTGHPGPDNGRQPDGGRDGDAKNERSSHELGSVGGVDHRLPHQIVARPHPEDDAEHAADRLCGDQDAEPHRSKRAGDDHRPRERHGPGHGLAAEQGAEIPCHPTTGLARLRRGGFPRRGRDGGRGHCRSSSRRRGWNLVSIYRTGSRCRYLRADRERRRRAEPLIWRLMFSLDRADG
jgi:hypothetical protein